ncbi:hypothetical protein NDU88_004088 [Pleurodeles waltl]|uniref:Uncharacterized protein n=1 Tax=Pleurodeles waltl TaxID=8319 RepID=A0AAV7WQV9_PLEWA|nr:hypothetical protein NDU88_004088 [Pleurodeles waltl]
MLFLDPGGGVSSLHEKDVETYTVLVEGCLAAKITSQTSGGRSKAVNCRRSISKHEGGDWTGSGSELSPAAATEDPTEGAVLVEDRWPCSIALATILSMPSLEPPRLRGPSHRRKGGRSSTQDEKRLRASAALETPTRKTADIARSLRRQTDLTKALPTVERDLAPPPDGDGICDRLYINS